MVGYSYQVASTTIPKYLTSTKIGEKGQLTIPKEFREDLGLEAGAPLAVLRIGGGLILLPEQQRLERLCQRIGGALTGTGVTPGAILATLPEARRRVFARHYGAGASRKKAKRRGK